MHSWICNSLERYTRPQRLAEAVPEMEIGAAVPPAPVSLNRVQKSQEAHRDVFPVAGSVEGSTWLAPTSLAGIHVTGGDKLHVQSS